MTVWIQPTEALAGQLDIPPVPLPVQESTAAELGAGNVDVAKLAGDVDAFLSDADATDVKTPVLRRCAAALALAAANGKTEEGDDVGAAGLLRLAVRHAPDDVGIRAAYGSALWMSGSRFDGLAQLTDSVRRNIEQGRMVPMLWILTARAMADAGRHGDALLLLEDLAATQPSNFSFWELIDAIDSRSSGIDGGFRPEHAAAVQARLESSVASASVAADEARSAIKALGVAVVAPTPSPPLCLEVTSSTPRAPIEAGRPGSLGMLDSTVAVVRVADFLSAPTSARSTVEIGFGAAEGEATALVPIGVDGAVDVSSSDEVIQAVSLCVATMPATAKQAAAAFDHVLGAGTSLALASILDVTASAIGLGVPASGLPVSALSEYASSPDGAGLRGAVRRLVGPAPDGIDVDEGMQELARRGFLELESDRANPLPYFGFLMGYVGSHVAWRRFTHHDTHALSMSRRYWLATAAGVLRLAPDGEGGVSWSVCDRDTMQRELGVELAIIST